MDSLRFLVKDDQPLKREALRLASIQARQHADSIALGLVYIAVFGIGSIGGMLLMSAMIGLPFAVTARRFSILNGGIRLFAGLFSVLFGLTIGWELLHKILKAST